MSHRSLYELIEPILVPYIDVYVEGQRKKRRTTTSRMNYVGTLICHGRSWTPVDLAAQRLCRVVSPALWGFPALASNESSPTNKG